MPKKKPLELLVTLRISAADAGEFPEHRNPAYLRACIERGVLAQLAFAKVTKVEVK